MNPRRAQQIERDDRLGDESVPFTEREVRVTVAENRNEMILEGPDGPFSSIHTMFLGGDFLEGDLILGECLFEQGRAFVVQDMKIGRMTLTDE